jgi:RimJ/RimL family protein N-acetyltransferase
MRQVIGTERLSLRRFRPDDGASLELLDADPLVMRFITGGAATPREIIDRQILPRFIRERDDAGVLGFWAAEHTAAFIGWFSLRAIDGLPGQASLGYRLCRAFWGRGLATEGATALLDRGFRIGLLDQVFATTYEDNRASIAVMKKLGMRFHRSFRMTTAGLASLDTAAAEPGEMFPGEDVEYVIDRQDWLTQGSVGGPEK